MYFNFYGFSKRPFDLTPDPSFLYLSPGHREALASLIYGIMERRGFITIIGEVGTGKTTLLRALLEQLDEHTKVGFIFNTDITFEEMLNMAVVDLGLSDPEEPLTKVRALARLNKFAIEQLTRGNKVAIIVDEAQNLDRQCMENIRLLSNLETGDQKLIQIILSGQPELDSKLKQPELRQLAQRISIKRYVTPLNENETYDYIQHRLAIANCKNKNIFSSRAKRLIWEYSEGVPRKINILCDNAFLIGYGLQKKRIKSQIIEEAIKDLSYSPFADQSLDNTEIKETKIQAPATAAAQPPVITTIPSKRRGRLMYVVTIASLILIGSILFGIKAWRPSNGESPKSYKYDIDRTPTLSPPSTSSETPSQDKTGTQNKVSVGSDLVLAETGKETIESAGPPFQQESFENTQQEEPVEDVQPEESLDIPQSSDLTDTSDTLTPEQGESWKSVTVKKDDMFSKLVFDVYGRATPDYVNFVREHNLHIKDIDKLMVGQKIYFPPLSEKK